MAAFYSNENFPLQVVLALRGLGHDVLTTHEAGQSNLAIPDHEVLDHAVRARRILITLNRRDFIALHEERSDHSGIVVCTVDADFAGQARRIHQVIEAAGEMNGKLLRVNRGK